MDQYLEQGKSFERLLNEYNKYGSLCVGVDFDGTLHDYHKIGAIHEQVRQLVRDLKSINCRIIIWTAYEDLNYVEKFCKSNDIPFDGINTDGIKLSYESKKPFFSALLDDRAGLIQVYNELNDLFSFIKRRNEVIKAPFSEEQVIKLNEYQKSEKGHPFTCCSPSDITDCKRKNDNPEDTYEEREGILIATKEGWICPCGKYKQNWAHPFMVK